VWALTHVATTLAAAGDTGRLVRLADSLEQIGALSAYGRDQLMHFYVRGLLSEARHDYGKAETEFRQAIYSPTVGYTRINLHLARVELALGRPKNAVATLQSALRGTFDGSNFYMTRTELHELLAQAFATDGQPDSARAHYAVVARAWRTGDASFRARAESAEAKSGVRLFP
jgi:predicted Zn-dependent protease